MFEVENHNCKKKKRANTLLLRVVYILKAGKGGQSHLMRLLLRPVEFCNRKAQETGNTYQESSTEL